MSKQLTKAEEQIMKVLWDLQEASVKEVIDKLPEPKPAYYSFYHCKNFRK